MAKQAKQQVQSDDSLEDIVDELNKAGRPDLAMKALARVASRPAQPTPEEIAEERHAVQQGFQTEHERQRGEVHHWITFNRMGEGDKVDMVDIGAAGVMYHIRKGHRVPLPQSAINALKLAVREGLDHGHPIERNGRKYLRRIRESDYSYSIEGTCTPEEAAQWRDDEARKANPAGEYVPADGGNDPDMVDIGGL